MCAITYVGCFRILNGNARVQKHVSDVISDALASKETKRQSVEPNGGLSDETLCNISFMNQSRNFETSNAVLDVRNIFVLFIRREVLKSQIYVKVYCVEFIVFRGKHIECSNFGSVKFLRTKKNSEEKYEKILKVTQYIIEWLITSIDSSNSVWLTPSAGPMNESISAWMLCKCFNFEASISFFVLSV